MGQKVLYIPVVSCDNVDNQEEPLRSMEGVQFYAKWAGYLWQNDTQYLAEDGLTHDTLAQLYVKHALQIAHTL